MGRLRRLMNTDNLRLKTEKLRECIDKPDREVWLGFCFYDVLEGK